MEAQMKALVRKGPYSTLLGADLPMSSKLGLKLLAGAVALSMASGAFAVTTADNNGTIFLQIYDKTQSTGYVFDTNVSVATYNDATFSFNQSVAGDANYQSFLNTIKSGDDVSYSVLGNTEAGTETALVTAVAQPTTVAGQKSHDVSTQIGTFLGQVQNQSAGSSFIASGANSASKFGIGYDGTIAGDLGSVSDSTAIGTPLAFYSVATTNSAGTRGGATVTALSHTWNLDSSGLLTYNAVPLPAPLLLLLSGLGLMGVVSRRGRQADDMGGAAA
jgi:hypothetical protein